MRTAEPGCQPSIAANELCAAAAGYSNGKAIGDDEESLHGSAVCIGNAESFRMRAMWQRCRRHVSRDAR